MRTIEISKVDELGRGPKPVVARFGTRREALAVSKDAARDARFADLWFDVAAVPGGFIVVARNRFGRGRAVVGCVRLDDMGRRARRDELEVLAAAWGS